MIAKISCLELLWKAFVHEKSGRKLVFLVSYKLAKRNDTNRDFFHPLVIQ